MGRDNSPKHRQQTKVERKAANRKQYARLLIVSEGSKTEPFYLKEIRASRRLPSANIQVYPSEKGTAPLQVVEYAKELIEKGNLHKGIQPRSFDQIYVVFDRDDHLSYTDAREKAKSLDGKLKNNENKPIAFKSIVSIPCFELWLLLHYQDIKASLHRNDVMQHLKTHIPDYEKGNEKIFAITCEYLNIATERARILALNPNAYSEGPYTEMAELVDLLINLRNT